MFTVDSLFFKTREVKEETKCVAKICKFGSVSHYWVKNRPKIVVFFDMVVEKEQFKPSGEVRALKWKPLTKR